MGVLLMAMSSFRNRLVAMSEAISFPPPACLPPFPRPPYALGWKPYTGGISLTVRRVYIYIEREVVADRLRKPEEQQRAEVDRRQPGFHMYVGN